MVRLYFAPTRLSTFALSAGREARSAVFLLVGTRDKQPIAGNKCTIAAMSRKA
jgi:hypothetical protein